MSNPTISSAEFQQKLQAGQINEALALVLNQASTLDVTTEITDDITANSGSSMSLGQKTAAAQFPNSEYLRTKINLITGEIQNEVGKDLIVNSISYIRLQQLHIDRIVASHRIVQGYLHQIQEILTAIESTRSRSDGEPELANQKIFDRLNIADSLPTRLAEAFRAILTSTASDLSPTILAAPIAEDIQEPLLPQPSPPLSHQPIVSPVAFDDGIDLSIDETTVVWEEWVEDEEDAQSAAIRDPDPAAQTLTIPTWGEDSDWQQLEPTTVKPAIPRTPAAAKSVAPSAQWDKFMPENVGIYVDPTPKSPNNNDPHQIDRLLADLDRISKE